MRRHSDGRKLPDKTNWQAIAERLIRDEATKEDALLWLSQYDGPLRYEIKALLTLIKREDKPT